VCNESLELPYCVYILRLDNGHLYIGSTQNLEQRLAEHKTGSGCWTTAKSRTIELLYSEPFPDRQSAAARELQLKRWSPAKKLALIQGDMAELKQLAGRHSI
jgi:predicted GIY-YIG superfamily endonuclease